MRITLQEDGTDTIRGFIDIPEADSLCSPVEQARSAIAVLRRGLDRFLPEIHRVSRPSTVNTTNNKEWVRRACADSLAIANTRRT